MEQLFNDKRFIELVRTNNYVVSYKTIAALGYSISSSYSILEQLKLFLNNKKIKYILEKNGNIIVINRDDFEQFVTGNTLSEVIVKLREKYFLDIDDNCDVITIIEKMSEKIDKLIEKNKLLEQLLQEKNELFEQLVQQTQQ